MVSLEEEQMFADVIQGLSAQLDLQTNWFTPSESTIAENVLDLFNNSALETTLIASHIKSGSFISACPWIV